MPRFPLMNQLSARQVAEFQTLAGIYRADLLDPGAWQALLLLLEICNILDLLPTVIDRIFGEGIRARVETWSGEIHPRHPQSPAPSPSPPRLGLAPQRTPPAPLPHRSTPASSGSTTSTIPRPNRTVAPGNRYALCCSWAG